MLKIPQKTSRTIPSIYSNLGLTDLPFPPDPVVNPYSHDPRKNGTIYSEIAVQKEIKKFEELLIRPDDFLNRAKLAYLWSKGDQQSGRGMGKTALLRYFRQRINKDWGYSEFKGNYSAAVIYVAFPSQVDRRFIEQLSLAALIDLCKSGLLNASLAKLRYEFLNSEDIKLLNIEEENFSNLLNDNLFIEKGINLKSVSDKIKEKIINYGVSSSIAEHFALGRFEDYLRSLRRDGNLEPLYIPRDTKILDYSRSLLFNEVVNFLRASDYQGAYLFIDDIENMVDQMTRKNRIEFAKEFAICTVRPGYANTTHNFFSCVLTTHQQASVALSQAWGDAGLSAIAKLDPSAQHSIELPLPPPDQAKNIIVAHLDYYRVNKDENGSIKPFTEDALEELMIKRGILHPRQLLATLSSVIVQAIKHNLTSINANFINTILEASAITPTSDYSEGIEDAL